MPAPHASRRTGPPGRGRSRHRAAGCGTSPRRNGSNTSERRCSGTPGPSSSTAIMTPPGSRQTRTHTRARGPVWRAAFASRFSTMRSTFAASITPATPSPTTSTGRSPSRSVPSTMLRTSADTSAGRRFGSRIPRDSRSRSSRSDSRRSSLRAFVARRPVRSRASDDDRSRSTRSRVSAVPRIVVSGVRSSWDTASRNVFFIWSSWRRWPVASRSLASVVCSSSSARLISVMSNNAPCQNRGRPSSPRTRMVCSRTHTVRPSRATMR